MSETRMYTTTSSTRLNILDFDGTTQKTSPPRSDETDFLSRNGGTGDSGGLSDMLMITTTVRMVDRVHSHTTSAGPAESHY